MTTHTVEAMGPSSKRVLYFPYFPIPTTRNTGEFFSFLKEKNPQLISDILELENKYPEVCIKSIAFALDDELLGYGFSQDQIDAYNQLFDEFFLQIDFNSD